MDRFISSDRCVICEEAIDWSVDYIGDKYQEELIFRNLRKTRLVYSDVDITTTDGRFIVHHHNHAQMKWRGPAHDSCNFARGNHTLNMEKESNF